MHPATWESAQSEQNLRCPQEESLGPSLPTERTAKGDQTARMPMLIWFFVGHAGHFVVFVMQRLIYERRQEKTCLRCVRPVKTQTGLLSYRD